MTNKTQWTVKTADLWDFLTALISHICANATLSFTGKSDLKAINYSYLRNLSKIT